MRINIYEEELTSEVHMVRKDVEQGLDEDGTPILVTFYGLRLYLESPQTILDHSTDDDDDRNAITYWVRAEGLQFLEGIMQRLHSRVAYERIGQIPSGLI